MIRCYDDFIEVLSNAGFSMGSGSADGIYAVITWGWQEEPPYETPVRWFSDNPDNCPAMWRMRILEERNDIAYAKLFFKKSGYITKEWYPYLLAVRRGGKIFEEAYEDGTISHFAKRIYDVVCTNEKLPVEAIKSLAGFTREDKSGFDRALTDLQMKMFLTICGQQERTSMPSNVFCTAERFFGVEVFKAAEKISTDEAIAKIREQILHLNPSAEDKKISKFILG